MKFVKGQHSSSSTEFKKGFIPWNKGLKGFGRWPKISLKGVDNPAWKGDGVGYYGLHRWIYKQLGKPCRCNHCDKTEGRFEWANKSKEYKRELNDWISLCYSCHDKYDEIWLKRNRDEKGRFL